MNYIALYAADFDWDIWQEYCNICGADSSAYCIRIQFDLNDVEYDCADDDLDDDCDDEDEEDDEDYDD